MSGNQVLNQDGQAVWLQGLNVVSLEWNAQGENVLRTARVALEEWKANVIRLPLNDGFWFGKAGGAHGGESYRALVNACGAAGGCHYLGAAGLGDDSKE